MPQETERLAHRPRKIPTPRVAVGAQSSDVIREAIEAAGATIVDLTDHPDGIVWVGYQAAEDTAVWEATQRPGLDWVHLPGAGIDSTLRYGDLSHGPVWTCSKGAFAEPVAEHALALSLAALRRFTVRARARSWGEQHAATLYDRNVTIIGAGGIAVEFMRLTKQFRVRPTVVRNRNVPVEGAVRTIGQDDLREALRTADLLLVAAPLTARTQHLIDGQALRSMRRDAVLVNVARGPIVVTEALALALQSQWIAGAALDVTDPEPLPDGHPLWAQENCLITPHTADTWEMIQPYIARRIAANIVKLRDGRPLVGVVSPDEQY